MIGFAWVRFLYRTTKQLSSSLSELTHDAPVERTGSDMNEEEDRCNRLSRSISHAATTDHPVFPPPSWAESPPSRAPEFDNFSSVSSIMNDRSLDVTFDLGRPVERSMPTLPFYANASLFHPCCAEFLSNATAGERTFENVEFGLADFFRVLGNSSRLYIAGDSVSRGSVQSAMCELVSSGADFYYMKWDHPQNDALINRTRENGGHAPTICNTWFRGWSSYHSFTLPPAGRVAEARIPLKAKVPSTFTADHTFHDLVWLREAREGMDIPKDSGPYGRTALLLNFGIWWNLGGSVNLKLKFEDDSPARLYQALKIQFKKIAAATQQFSSVPFVFWRESTPQLFPNFDVARGRSGCEKLPDFLMGGNFHEQGNCAEGKNGEGVYGWTAGPCQRDNDKPLGWNQAAPYRWRQRLAMHAALEARIQIAMPPVTSYNNIKNKSGKGEVLWLPFHDAALQNRGVYNHSGDCTHPNPFRRAFWSVLWDGMARHVIKRRCNMTK